MPAATYRVGPSDFFTPGDLESDAATLDNQVEQLDAQVEGNEAVPPLFVDQWVAFQGQWKAFYADHFSGFFSSLFSALNDGNRDELVRYENQFQAFADKAASGWGAQVIAPVLPSSGTKDTLGEHAKAQAAGLPLPSISSIVVLAVAAVVVLVVWKS